MITHLKRGQIFVFESNLAGRHGAGAAWFANQNFGAKYGQGVGLQGRSYAIPTKDHSLRVMSVEEIRPYVVSFIAFARENPDLEFLVTPIGTGLAGHSHEDIAPLFYDVPRNVILPAEWVDIFSRNN